ncbi:MAG: DUF1778 domain-containing protein [Planctomycetes bacterium]|nr:DUF1778 domain-containing protein [Planctomycetota bacterium]
MATGHKNEARLGVRLNKQLKELIERAALLTGQNVSDFAVSVLAERARQVVQDHETTVLSDRDRDLFLAMLDKDAEPNEALKKAANRLRSRV